ncbi:hypothetical protein COCON_G00231270 [Conger conger]|uniref:Uncharacterized protein n=1 Tax=Conger conger TaxID=82655 RepID=A0A9Q1CVJ6_CONCO|nr:hypothetical protein COCON_G00231270 [Conger conger]
MTGSAPRNWLSALTQGGRISSRRGDGDISRCAYELHPKRLPARDTRLPARETRLHASARDCCKKSGNGDITCAVPKSKFNNVSCDRRFGVNVIGTSHIWEKTGRSN